MPTSNVTDYGADFLLGLITGQETMPATLYAALTTSSPDVGFDGTLLATIEPTDANYARILFDNDDTFWSAPDEGFVVNILNILFDAADDDYPSEITHFAVCTAVTLGEVILYGEFTESKPIFAGQEPDIAIGILSLGLSGPPVGELSQ